MCCCFLGTVLAIALWPQVTRERDAAIGVVSLPVLAPLLHRRLHSADAAVITPNAVMNVKTA